MINTDDMTKEERAEYWEMVMEDFAGSSKTKIDYCKENEIPVSTFNYWVNRLEELKRADNPAEDRFVELPQSVVRNNPFKIESNATASFVPEMEIACNGMRILINSSTPMTLLSSVLREFDHA